MNDLDRASGLQASAGICARPFERDCASGCLRVDIAQRQIRGPAMWKASRAFAIQEHQSVAGGRSCQAAISFLRGASTNGPPHRRGWYADPAGAASLEHSGGSKGRGDFVSPRLLGALALLRNPRELDSEGLGRAATAAAREGLDDTTWWEALAARARELVPHLALHDATTILNGMARARQIDRAFVEALLPRMSGHLVYLTSAHLAMLASGVAKAEVHDARFVAALTRELKARLMEFHSPMEVTMIVNAASKLRIADEDLYRRFVTHIQSQMGKETFHVRDLSVIVGALARVQCASPGTMAHFADCAVQTLPQASPLELARLMHACMSVSCAVHDFFSACVLQSKNQCLTMDPSGLSSAAFAFGQCFEVAEVAHMRYMRRIFRNIRLASIASLPLFLPREIVSLLRTYARWQIAFDLEHLRRVAERMLATQAQFDRDGAVSALYSLGLLMQRNSARSGAATSADAAWAAVGEAARRLHAPVWLAASRGELDSAKLLRAVEASVALQANDTALPSAVSAAIARIRAQLDPHTCSTLYELLSQTGLSSADDLMLALADHSGVVY